MVFSMRAKGGHKDQLRRKLIEDERLGAIKVAMLNLATARLLDMHVRRRVGGTRVIRAIDVLVPNSSKRFHNVTVGTRNRCRMLLRSNQRQCFRCRSFAPSQSPKETCGD